MIKSLMRIYWVAGGLIGVGFLVMLVFSGSDVPQAYPTMTVSAEGYFENVHLISYTAEGLQWEADVSSAIVQDSSGSVRMSGIDLVYPEAEVTLKADSGQYLLSSGEVVLTDGVTVTNRDFVLKAGRLVYRPWQRRLIFDEGVSVSSEAFNVSGQKAEIYRGSILRFTGDVKTTFTDTM